MTPKDKLTKAKVALLLKEPFFGTLLLGLRMEEDKQGIACGAMATDGKRLYWDAEFVKLMSVPNLVCVLSHECLHCGLLHMLRLGNRDPSLANIAMDHAVNLMMESCNVQWQWPADPYEPLKDPKYKGLEWEEIYARLPKKPSGKGGAGKAPTGGKQSYGMGGVIQAPADPVQKQEIESQWKINMVQALQAAKMQGRLPAELARLVDEVLNPKVPWQDVLRQHIRARATDDFVWSRPNRRYAHTGFILPSLHSNRMGRVAVAIDTSGSISGDMLNAFMSEVEGIVHECRPEKVVLIDCDARVNSMVEYEPTDVLPREFKGGGGTSHVPVFEALENDHPEVLVCLTDLYTSFPDEAPPYDVIWAVYGGNKQKPPFGETIEIGE